MRAYHIDMWYNEYNTPKLLTEKATEKNTFTLHSRSQNIPLTIFHYFNIGPVFLVTG